MTEPAEVRETPPRERIGLDEALVAEVREALERGDTALATALARTLHPSDLADLLQLLEPDQRLRLLRALGPDVDPDTFAYLDETVREELLERLGPEWSGRIVAGLDVDDAVDVLEDLDRAEREAILRRLPFHERIAVEEQLRFPEDSAGRLMQRDFVAVPEYWLVGQTIDYLRATPGLPDDFYDIFIVDPRMRPVGGVPVSRVLRSRRQVAMRDLKLKELHLIPATMDQEEVAFLFRQYGLVSAPVVDGEGRIIGVVTVDDVVDVIEEEAEEDILALGGVSETDVFVPPAETVRRRAPWLFVNLLTAVVASAVIALFEDTIARVVSLAVLMPIVASMGGNAGTQTLTVAVRALATRELSPANASRVIVKELLAGAMNGLLFLAVGAGLALAWFGDPALAAVFGLAMLVNLVAAALSGVAIPLLLHRLGLDPAVSSSVFLTTVTDVVGFFAFLGLAKLVLLD